MEAIAIIDGKSKDHAEGAIPEILNKALSVTFDTNVGHDYLENADRRFDFYHKTEDKIAFDLDMFNQITNGGIPRKTLNIILAGTGVGKSLGMCHLAAADLSQGRNVLYITMEMAEERIAERIDANLFDVRIDELKNLSSSAFSAKVKNVADRTKGKLVIKEYPTASAHAGHFRALLHELKLKKKFTPDVIYIDYLNICASSRIKGLSGGVNTYSLIKAIAEELRGLAVEFNVPIWSATQVTRGGYNSSDVELTDTSESFGLPATADLMIAFISTEELEKMNQLMVKQLKNRYNDANVNKRFTVGIDRSKMRLYDIADPTANIMNDGNSSSAVAAAGTPFSRGQKDRGKSFNDFNV
jgi:replicative DNA helicase